MSHVFSSQYQPPFKTLYIVSRLIIRNSKESYEFRKLDAYKKCYMIAWKNDPNSTYNNSLMSRLGYNAPLNIQFTFLVLAISNFSIRDFNWIVFCWILHMGRGIVCLTIPEHSNLRRCACTISSTTIRFSWHNILTASTLFVQSVPTTLFSSLKDWFVSTSIHNIFTSFVFFFLYFSVISDVLFNRFMKNLNRQEHAVLIFLSLMWHYLCFSHCLSSNWSLFSQSAAIFWGLQKLLDFCFLLQCR